MAFDNGARFELAAEYLSGRIAQRRGARPSHVAAKTIVTGKEDVKINGLEPVGNYAVRIGLHRRPRTAASVSWAYLHKLGAEKDRIWAEYLTAAAKK